MEFDMTAVFNGSHYQHFGIHPKSVSLYGKKVEDIVHIRMRIAQNQEVPEHIAGPKSSKEADYWGWFDSEQNRFVSTMIWPSYLQLGMCFTYGMKAEEDRGRGKGYRLEIIK